MATPYDVIIIGTGAGGGTLAYRLAPTGKRILLLERGDYVPREKENWDSHAVVVEGRYNIKDAVARPGRPGVSPRHALLRRRQHQVLRRRAPPAAPRGLRRGRATTAASRPPGRSPTRTSSRTTRRPSTSTRCTASAATIRPSRRRARRTASRRSATSRGSSSSCDDLTRLGHRPFPLPVGIMRDEPNPRRSRCIRCDTCDGFPCLVHAKADAQVICVDPALEHPNVTLLTGAYVSRLETSAIGPRGDDGARRAPRRPGDVHGEHRRGRLRRHQLRRAAAALGRATATRTGSRTARASSVGTTCATSTRCSWRSPATRTRRVFQKTWGLNDFYFATAGLGLPDGPHLHDRQDGRQHPARRRPAPRTGLDAREDGGAHAARSGSPSEDLPDPDNRVSARPRRPHRARLPPEQRRGARAADRPAPAAC